MFRRWVFDRSSHVAPRWLPCGVPLAPIWRPAGSHVAPRWLPYGIPLAPIWRPVSRQKPAGMGRQPLKCHS